MCRSAGIRLALFGAALLAAGCTTLDEWIHNGFKVGPNCPNVSAAVAVDWIDGDDPHIVRTSADDDEWWRVFNDDVLDSLIESAYGQNLDLKTAGTRVLQAQAQRNITAGNLLPQSQSASGDYLHAQISRNLNFFGNPLVPLPTNLNVWATGFNASWELDVWGRFRRALESSNAQLGSSVEGYHDVLVTLFADTATNYIQYRTFQERLAFVRRNVELQRGTLRLAQARLDQGKGTSLDVEQAQANLAQTESSIPPLVLGMRQANNRLCVLIGRPPQSLANRLGDLPLPTTPPSAAVGIPAELLSRRPDVRRALRDIAAQSAQIGVAEADFYPAIGVSGFIGYAADDIRTLFNANSFTGIILPNFSWKILNYGRILNNVRSQNALLQQRVFQYEQTVLTAGREVEDNLEAYIQAQLQARSLEVSVKAYERTVQLVLALYGEGRVDFNRVFTTQSELVMQEDQLAQVRGNIALNLIAVYRALGGGWKRSCTQPIEKLPPPRIETPAPKIS